MNNQIPYGFFPPFNFEQGEIKQINDRIYGIKFFYTINQGEDKDNCYIIA